jgi:hypothetical protein
MATMTCMACMGKGQLKTQHYTIPCGDCGGRGYIEKDYGAGNDRSSGGDVFPWIIAALAGFYAWFKTRDETATAIAAIAAGVLANTKYGRVACIVVILWCIGQVVLALA